MEQVKYIGYGIGCRIGEVIYLNKKLKNYPELNNAILLHEKKHTNGFSWSDVVLDLNVKELNEMKKEYYLFILKHPSSWTELFPFWFYDKKFVWNPLITVIYLFSFTLGRFLWLRIA